MSAQNKPLCRTYHKFCREALLLFWLIKCRDAWLGAQEDVEQDWVESAAVALADHAQALGAAEGWLVDARRAQCVVDIGEADDLRRQGDGVDECADSVG